MTKYEFLGDLSRLLSDLPEDERKQAMKYYEDYFADAGESHEQEVLQELGSPERIAQLIREDSSETIEYGDSRFARTTDYIQPYDNSSSNGRDDKNQSSSDQTYWQNNKNADSNWQNTQTGYPNDKGHKNQNSSNDTSRIVILIILIILSSPVWLSVLTGLFSLILGIIATAFGIFAALILGGGGVAIGGIACFIGGLIAAFAGEAAAGILTIGVGCILFSVGTICCYLGVMLCIKFSPAVYRSLLKSFHWCSKKFSQIFQY
ncbi:MAG: DUF1700 domain-containing protein [Lachnospiraceae bacterium]|nr:DUF1700 domain-containing protein [Lachnospiraceae bacterium]